MAFSWPYVGSTLPVAPPGFAFAVLGGRKSRQLPLHLHTNLRLVCKLWPLSDSTLKLTCAKQAAEGSGRSHADQSALSCCQRWLWKPGQVRDCVKARSVGFSGDKAAIAETVAAQQYVTRCGSTAAPRRLGQHAAPDSSLDSEKTYFRSTAYFSLLRPPQTKV